MRQPSSMIRLSLLAALSLGTHERMAAERLHVIDATRSSNGHNHTGCAKARRAAAKRRNVRARASKRA